MEVLFECSFMPPGDTTMMRSWSMGRNVPGGLTRSEPRFAGTMAASRDSVLVASTGPVGFRKQFPNSRLILRPDNVAAVLPHSRI